MVMEKSTEKKTSNKKQFTKVFKNKNFQKRALKEAPTEKKEPVDVSKVINGVRKLKVEANTRNSVGPIPVSYLY